MPAKKLTAEFLGTLLLSWVVIGSGIMGSKLTDDLAVVLLINALSTILALGLLIFFLGPISGAHFNPAVSLVQLLRREISPTTFVLYSLSQVLGAISGAALANASFERAVIEFSSQGRAGWGLYLAEVAATAGLIAIIVMLLERGRQDLIPIGVAAWIGSAYFFTSSTSFANPALTIGRSFTDSFAGIAPGSIGAFVAAQLAGALLGLAVARFFRTASSQPGSAAK